MPRALWFSRRARVRITGVLASGVSLLLSGCGDDGLDRRYPVSGKITYKGEPVARGSIAFHPVGGAGGQLGVSGVVKDGYYTLSTHGNDDGAFPGNYKVSVAARVPDLTKAKATAAKLGGLMTQDDVALAYKRAKSSIPRKYESPEAGLKAKVEAGRNTFDFDLVD